MVKKYTANITQFIKSLLNNIASNSKMNGTQSAGSSNLIARADHVHPTDTSRAASNHTHGSLSNDGKVGTAANKPLITGTNGVVSVGSFGTGANTFCQGNDSRLSDARTPKSHTHNKSQITDFPTTMPPTSHTHLLDDINVTSALTANDNLDNYTDVGIYTCSKTNSETLANKPYTGEFACIIENKKFSSGYVIQFVYKITTQARTFYDAYFRCHNGINGWTADWVRIFTDQDMAKVNASNIKLNNSSNLSIEDAIAGKVDSTDSRLSDARTPKSHTHGNITNAGAIGATANKPLITGTNGVVSVGSFGTGANTFCQGNDSRLSDYRIPKTTEITGTVDEPFDLDSLVDTGLYYGNRANVLRTTNTPDDTYASRYVVFVEGFEQTSTYVKQTFTFFNNGKTYVRNKKGSSWTSWVELTYIHPSYTARTGVPTTNQSPDFGDTFSVSQPVCDATGHITAINSRTITIPSATASSSANGLMSKSDKARLDSIVSKNSSSATTYTSLKNSWTGTVKTFIRNNFMIVTYENLKKSSTTSSYDDVIDLANNNSMNANIYGEVDLSDTNTGVAVRVSTDGKLQARCLIANHAKYGHIIVPIN